MTLDLDRPRTPFARLLSYVEARAPRSVAPIVAQARRDVAVVEGRLLLGAKPPSLVRRRGAEAFRSSPAVELRVAPAPVAAPAPAAKGGVGSLTILEGDTSRRVSVAEGQLVLEAVLAEGVNVPFSCTLGGCGTCKVQLLEGEIELEEPHCLTPDELADGLRLICVGRLASPSCVVRLERE